MAPGAVPDLVVVWDVAELVAEIEDGLPVVVEVDRFAPADAPELWLRAEAGSVCRFRLTEAAGVLTLTVLPDPQFALGATPSLLAAVLVVVGRRAAGPDTERVVLDRAGPVIRGLARRLGFTGPLRRPLARPLWSAAPGGADSSPPAPDTLEEAVAALLPGVEVVRRASSRLRTASRAAQTGLSSSCELEVRGADDDRALRVTVADGRQVLVEEVALAIDTTLAMRRAFGAAGSCLRTLAFDRAHHGFRSGQVGGMAHQSIGSIHLNGAYLTAEGRLGLIRQQWERANRPGRQSRYRPSARPTDPRFTPLDGVTAHECWHVIDGVFVLERFDEAVAFRRRLGQHLGVETLEQALYGAERRATAAQRAAHARLADEVSPYATTSILEATAELFKLWWCTPDDPPPILRLFGELLDQFFHVHRRSAPG